MAKISANGERECARYEHPEDGRVLVLTEKNGKPRRMLGKSKGGAFTLRGKLWQSHHTLDQVKEQVRWYAAGQGYVQVLG